MLQSLFIKKINMKYLTIIIFFILVMDTVVSFVALFIAFTNRGKILKNKLKILLNKKSIENIENKFKN